MREVISVHVGQAGIQLGEVCWHLYCLEHGLDLRGNHVEDDRKISKVQSNLHESYDSVSNGVRKSYSNASMASKISKGSGLPSFFVEMNEGNYSPRAILVDLEPSVIDGVKTGPIKDLFSPNNIINGIEDAANNYARGHYTAGKKILKSLIDPVRKMAEDCDKLQGFMLFHSFGGGTGSGFSALLTSTFKKAFHKTNTLEISIFPSPTLATAVVEPYNAVLATNYTLEHTDCVFLADNEAMYNICKSKLDIDSPTYLNLNQLLAQTVSSITASLRFQGTLNADFADFQTNLVPFPRIHFPVVSYAPIVSRQKMSHQTLTVSEITNKCFDHSNRMVKCDNEAGCYMSCCLLYRGDVAAKDVNAAINALKKRKEIKFVDWCPTGYKIGLNSSPPCVLDEADMAHVQRAACMICNTTAIKDAWARLNAKYSIMLNKKAFTHWYIGEGMEMSEFHEALDNVLTLEDEYELLMTKDDKEDEFEESIKTPKK